MVWALLSQKEKRIEIVPPLSQEIQTLYYDIDDVVLKLHFVQEFEGQYSLCSNLYSYNVCH